MTGIQIIQEIEKTEISIKQFNSNSFDTNTLKSSYSDWTSKDVLAHINEWIKYSANKLYCIKSNKVLAELGDYHEFNKLTYERTNSIKSNDIIMEISKSISQYKKIVQMYNDKDLLSKDFPTGFSFELWRYMIMDGSIHPNLHLMFHYLKNGQYKELIEIIDNTKIVFLHFSGNDMNVYDFSDFVEEKSAFFIRLRELKIFSQNDSFISQIVNLNIKNNS